jgi:hypothetical protein
MEENIKKGVLLLLSTTMRSTLPANDIITTGATGRITKKTIPIRRKVSISFIIGSVASTTRKAIDVGESNRAMTSCLLCI